MWASIYVYLYIYIYACAPGIIYQAIYIYIYIHIGILWNPEGIHIGIPIWSRTHVHSLNLYISIVGVEVTNWQSIPSFMFGVDAGIMFFRLPHFATLAVLYRMLGCSLPVKC